MRVNIRPVRLLSFLILILLATEAQADYIDITNEGVETKHKAYNFIIYAKEGNRQEYGIAAGYRDKQHELYGGIQNEGYPFLHYLYSPKTLRVQFDLNVSKEYQRIGFTYLLKDDWGVLLTLDSETLYYGLRKTF